MLLALLVLRSLDRLDLALYATFGAFTSVYGGATPSWPRWKTQLGAGVVLVTAVLSGMLVGLSPDRAWLVIPVSGAWAALAATMSDRLSWRPPGPLFAVFAVAACGSIPTTPAGLGAGLAVAVSAAVVAVLLGALETRMASRRWAAASSARQKADPASTVPNHPRPSKARRRVQAVRCAAAVAVAGTIATTAGIGHPYWAMVAAVAPMAALTLPAQISRGAHRALGTSVGLLVAVGLLHLDLPPTVTLLVVAALQGTSELLVARNYAAALVFVTPLALLLGQLADPQPVAALVTDRFVETVIGVSVGVLVVLLTRPRARAAHPVPHA